MKLKLKLKCLAVVPVYMDEHTNYLCVHFYDEANKTNYYCNYSHNYNTPYTFKRSATYNLKDVVVSNTTPACPNFIVSCTVIPSQSCSEDTQSASANAASANSASASEQIRHKLCEAYKNNK